MQRADSLEKTLILGKTEGQSRRGWQRIRWFSSITDSMDINLSKSLGDSREQRSLACCSPWGCKESDMTVQLNNNNAVNTFIMSSFNVGRKNIMSLNEEGERNPPAYHC